MRRFVELFKAVDATTATNSKVAALRDYFVEAKPENAVWALYLLMRKQRRKVLTSRVLREVYLSVSDTPEWLMKDAQAHVGDTAEAIALLVRASPPGSEVAGRKQVEGEKKVEDKPLHVWLESEIPKAQGASDEEKRDLVLRWWASLPPDDIFVLHKILTGSFRVGVSSTLVTRALAEALGIDKAILTHRLMGDFPPTKEFFETLDDPDAQGVRIAQPYPFLLAYQVELDVIEREGLEEYRVEWKWDGIRAQAVKREGEFNLWSRGEDLISEQFPELSEALLGLPDGTVVDGEVVAWDGEMPLSFNHLQRRLGRKKVGKKILAEVPTHFLAYDLLEDKGVDIRDLPLLERREKLEQLLGNTQLERVTLTEGLPVETLEDLEALRSDSRSVNAEGLMLKRLSSPYLVGRRKGLWWKHKVDPYTLDAVLIYAQAGTGRRANLFTDYTFALWTGDPKKGGELVSFTKAYSGLTDEEIAKLDRWIRANTNDRFGPVRAVTPVQVFELALKVLPNPNATSPVSPCAFPEFCAGAKINHLRKRIVWRRLRHC